jgi:hypothetical protein
MSKEKNFVEGGQPITSTPWCPKSHHTNEFYKLIDNFFAYAECGDYLETNNELLEAFMVQSLEDGISFEHIHSTIYLTNFQTQFITTLKDRWEKFKRFNEITGHEAKCV